VQGQQRHGLVHHDLEAQRRLDARKRREHARVVQIALDELDARHPGAPGVELRRPQAVDEHHALDAARRGVQRIRTVHSPHAAGVEEGLRRQHPVDQLAL
jgi:hypothetical protein